MTDNLAWISDEAICAVREWTRPSFILRLVPHYDGEMWCVLYGDDTQSGIAGFGETPMEACRDFDKAFGWGAETMTDNEKLAVEVVYSPIHLTIATD